MRLKNAIAIVACAFLLLACEKDNSIVPRLKIDQTVSFANAILQDKRYILSEITTGGDSLMLLEVDCSENAIIELYNKLPDEIVAMHINTPQSDDVLIDTLSFALFNASTNEFDNAIYCCYKNDDAISFF